jgi:hypothetical protein
MDQSQKAEIVRNEYLQRLNTDNLIRTIGSSSTPLRSIVSLSSIRIIISTSTPRVR